MTTLRDDGYLETDDPVVAKCCIGEEVYAGMGGARSYLIPAATVAEVALDDDGETATNAAGVIGLYQTNGPELFDWLRKHTG